MTTRRNRLTGYGVALGVSAALWGLLAWAVTLSAQGLTVRVLAVTHVQAVLEYTAPDGDACTVKVSETNDFEVYTPVNDVASGGVGLIFDSQDAHLDTSRDTTVCVDTSLPDDGTCGTEGERRTVVIGRYGMDVPSGGTNWWLGDDSDYYSRALQADTTHYFEIDCGGTDVGTGSFTTQTIPYNMTFKDPNPVRSPGVENWYTFPADDRSAVVIDPYTGARISRWTLQAEESGQTFAAGSGGGSMLCSGVVDANGGYHCGIMRSGGEASAMYWFHPTTGEIRHLGLMYVPGNSDPVDGWTGTNYYLGDGGIVFDPSDAHVVYGSFVSTADSAHRVIVKFDYTGGDVAVAAGANITWTRTNLTKVSEAGTLSTLMEAFDATAAATRFTPAVIGAAYPDYLLFQAKRAGGSQETYGYIGAFDISEGDVVAMAAPWKTETTRWCGMHTVFQANGGQHMFVANKGLYADVGDPGTGPWKTTLNEDLDTTETVITVAGEPYCTNGTPSLCRGESAADDTTLLDWAVGDYLRVESTGEFMRIVTKNSSTELVVTRDVYQGDGVGSAASSGAVVTPDCVWPATAGTTSLVWNFVNDPDGNDIDGNYCEDGNIAYSHEGATGYRDTSLLRWSGWKWTTGVLPGSCTTPTAAVERTPAFAGTDSPGEGNTYEIHPSMAQYPWASGIYAQYLLDINKTVGGNQFTENTTTGLVAVGGTTYLYRYVPIPALPVRPRRVPAFGMTEEIPLQMITGTLNDTVGDHYKFCLAERTNECVTGSTVGQIYVNFPSAPTYMGCGGGEASPTDPDACIGNAIFYGNAVVQIGTTTTGARVAETDVFPTYKWDYSRVLMVVPGRYRQMGEGVTMRATPDGRWAFIPLGNDDTTLDGLFLIRIPSMSTAPETKYDTYVQNQIVLPNVSATYPTVHNAVVKVGYVEYGAFDDFYCTQRQEACYFGNVAADGDGNYVWPATEDASCAGSKPCAGYAADGGGTAGNQIVGKACATGCTITVPTLPGKIAYVQAVYRESNNTTLGTSQVVVLPGLSQVGVQ